MLLGQKRMLLIRKTRFSAFYFFLFLIGCISFAAVPKTEAQPQPESQKKFEQIKKSSSRNRSFIKINNSEWLEKLPDNTFIKITNKSGDKILYASQVLPPIPIPPGIDINQTEVFLVSSFGQIKGELDGRTVVIDLSPKTYPLLLSSESEPIRPEFLNFSVYLQENRDNDKKRKLIPFEKKIMKGGKVDLLLHKWGYGLEQIKVDVRYIGHQEKILTLNQIVSIRNRAIILSKPFNSVRGKIHVSNQKNEPLNKVTLTIKNKGKVLWRSFSDNPITSFSLSSEDVKDKDIESGYLTLQVEKVGFKDKTVGLKRGKNTIILEPNSIKLILREKNDKKRFLSKEKVSLVVWKENKNNEKTYILNSQVITGKDGSFNFIFPGWKDSSKTIKVSIRAKGYKEVVLPLDQIAKYPDGINLTKVFSEIKGLATVKDESGNRVEGASYTILRKLAGENGKEFHKVFSKGKSNSKGIIHFNYRKEELYKLKIKIEKVGYKPVSKKLRPSNFHIKIKKIKGFGVPMKVTVLDCFKSKIKSPKGLLWVKPESGFLDSLFESSNEKENQKAISLSLHFPINYLPVAKDKKYLFEYIEDGQKNYEYEVDGKNFSKGKIKVWGTRQMVDYKIEVNGIKKPYSIIYSLDLDGSNEANELNGIENTIKGKVKVDCNKGKHLKIFFKGNKFYNEVTKSIQLLPVEKQNTIFKEQHLTLRPSNIYIFVNTVGHMGKTLDHLNNVLPEIVSNSKSQKKNNIKSLEVFRTKKGKFNKLQIDKLGFAPDPASEERPKELLESAVRDLSDKEGPGHIIYITNSTRADRYPDLINSISQSLFKNKGVKFFSLLVGDHDSDSLKKIADYSFGQYKRVSSDKDEIRNALQYFIENR